MHNLQKMGGAAALLEALTFVVGFGLFLTVLAPPTGDIARGQNVAFLVANQPIIYLANLIIYIVFGVFLVVLTLALYERLKVLSPAIAQTATAFGLMWAGLVIASGMIANIGTGVVVGLYSKDPTQAGLIWSAIQTVVTGLGGGNEIVGGVWVLLISWIGLRAGGLPKALNYLGVVIGVAGILTTIPPLGELGSVFGLGLILWFGWLGIVMLRNKPSQAA